MTTITTKLIRDGNSVAVRLPKTVLVMSGLRDTIQMEVSEGQITLRSANNPRSGWKEQIAQVVSRDPKSLQSDIELSDWDKTSNDGLN
ncbi:MAG: AbrB/MazE/SpoVT family DNA-binding domain-containing protein [bacterium]